MGSWQSFKTGDSIEIVAPASSVPMDHVDGAVEILRSWGLAPLVNKNMFNGHPYLANDDKERLRFLKKALQSRSRGIWCVRGGYGSIRLIPELLQMSPPPSKKLLIGYSDISSLHLFLQQKFKWISCHGALLESLFLKKYSEQDLFILRQTLFGEITEMAAEVEPMNKIAQLKKSYTGELMGGNLMTFVSHFGTGLSPKLGGKVLFFEETAERGYRLDRLFSQLLQQRDLAKVKAVVLGDILGGEERSGERYTDQALGLFADQLNMMKIPLFKGLPVGHGATNQPVFCGQPATVGGGMFRQKTGVLK